MAGTQHQNENEWRGKHDQSFDDEAGERFHRDDEGLETADWRMRGAALTALKAAGPAAAR